MLTRDFNYGYDGDRANNSNMDGIFAPVRLGNFFMSDLVGSAENTTGATQIISRILCCVVSSRHLHGLRDFITKGHRKMQNLISYTFKDVEIRTTLKNDAPWFAMADVAKALNYTHTPDAVRILDEDEKDVQIMHTPSGDQKLTIINESGLYSLILRSRKPEAKAFKKFVTSVVLPSIRKTGQYVDRSRFAELPFDPIPYTPADFVGNKEFMKAIGGMVKKCCAVAIKDAFTGLAQKEPVKVTWPQGKKLDESLMKVATAILDYGQHRETTGRVQGMLTAALDPEFNKIKQKLI